MRAIIMPMACHKHRRARVLVRAPLRARALRRDRRLRRTRAVVTQRLQNEADETAR